MQSSKTVVITGASSGIGLALATAFAGHGARVVANSRHVTQSQTLAPSPDLVLVDGDIASPDVAARVIEAADRFGDDATEECGAEWRPEHDQEHEEPRVRSLDLFLIPERDHPERGGQSHTDGDDTDA